MFKKLIFILLYFIVQENLYSQVLGDTRPYELLASDKKLNECYKKILNNIQVSDRIKLKQAQRKWIIFRDLDCKNQELDCMIERTDNRIKELRETLFIDKKGSYRSIHCKLVYGDE